MSLTVTISFFCAGILSRFKNVFGHERMSVHAESDEEMLHSVQHQWELIESSSKADASSRHQFIACASVSSADSLQSLLSKHLGGSSYRVLLHSVARDSSCYSFRATLKESSSISGSGQRFLRYIIM